MQMTNHKRSERGVTLVEMIVVVAIAVMMMRLLLPAFKGLGGSKQSFAATTQFIGDLSTARLMAMNNGAPVYVVFMPLPTNPAWPLSAAQRDYFELPEGGNPRLGGQLVSYAFYAKYTLTSNRPQWLSDWKRLSDGAFFPSEMLNGFEKTSVISLQNDENKTTFIVPYIGFDARGQLIGVPDVNGFVIRLVEGGVLPPELAKKTLPDGTVEYVYDVENADEPSIAGRVENYIRISRLTGRARTAAQQRVPPSQRKVEIVVLRFTKHLWESPQIKDTWVGLGGYLEDLVGPDGFNDGNFQRAWADADCKRKYLWVEGQLRLKTGVKVPVVIKNIKAVNAGKVLAEIAKIDPDAELLIQ
jgi:type II secretory pathway pseudopilin PulG